MKSQLLSVIIPTYNRSSFVQQAINSALSQQGVEIEVIVVDDGSSDDTRDILEKRVLSQNDSRIQYIWQEHSGKAGIARNNGMRYARGEFVAFLDSDDVWCTNHASLCIEELKKHPECGVVFSEHGLISQDDHVIKDKVKKKASDGEQFIGDLCLKRVILLPSVAIIRHSVLGSGDVFDASLDNGGEDWFLWVSLAQKTKFLRLEKRTVWIRIHQNKSYHSPDNYARSLILSAKKVITAGLPKKLGLPTERIMAINYMFSAYPYYLSRDYKRAWSFLFKAVGVYKGILLESDFWSIVIRLCLGKTIPPMIRRFKQRPRIQIK